MAIYCAAAEHGGLIKKERKRKKPWVKLKAFPTNIGQPNKTYARLLCVLQLHAVKNTLV